MRMQACKAWLESMPALQESCAAQLTVAQVMEWANQYYEQGYTQEQVEAWMASLTPDAPQVRTNCTHLHCSTRRAPGLPG